MIHPQPEMSPSDRVRVWLGFFGTTFFSALILLFLFWAFTTSNFLDDLRKKSVSSAHMLLIFGTPPSDQEISGLKVALEKIAGGKSVVSMSEMPQENKRATIRSRRILSVTLSLGKTPGGKIVNLSDQVQSIQSIVKNDSQINEVIFNPEWVSKVDEMAHISERIRRSLILFLGVLLAGISLYWGGASREIWQFMVAFTSPVSSGWGAGDRSLQFQRVDEGKDGIATDREFSPESEHPCFTVVTRVKTSALFGGFSGIVAIFIMWTSKSMIYPDGVNPFRDLVAGITPQIPLWVLYPILTAIAGGMGGLAHEFFSPHALDGKDHDRDDT